MPKKKDIPPVQQGSLAVKPDHRAGDNPTGFWNSSNLDALAARQNVGPITDATILLGGWPGDVDDGFEDAVRKLRDENAMGVEA